MKRSGTVPRFLVAVVLCFALALAMASCGKSDESPSGDSDTPPAVAPENGYVAYMYGPYAEPYENYYEGTWRPSSQAGKNGVSLEAVEIDLELTEGAKGAPSAIKGTFALVYFPDSPEYLYVEYIDGDPLVHTQKLDGVLEFIETLG